MHRCDLCWEEFNNPADLLAHEKAEDETLYPLPLEDGCAVCENDHRDGACLGLA